MASEAIEAFQEGGVDGVGCGWNRICSVKWSCCGIQDPEESRVHCFGEGERHCKQLCARAPSPDVTDVPLPLIPVRGKQEGGGLSGESEAKRKSYVGNAAEQQGEWKSTGLGTVAGVVD